MRKFIVSDLHGNGEVYDSIIGFLDNISLLDEVELYINGDLIDRGIDSYRMLFDVYERVNGKGNIKVHYLAGNHELMMYQALLKRKPNHNVSRFSDWMKNGGYIIEGKLDMMEDGEEMCEVFKSFLGTLDVYHKFIEEVNGNKLLLVHAQAPREVYDDCHLKIVDNNKAVEKAVWTREEIKDMFLYYVGKVVGYNRVGKDGFFTIIGHNPVNNKDGFKYHSDKNYLNIDGGCTKYAVGMFSCDHVPLVEVLDDSLNIIVFNHNNEIISGYSIDSSLCSMDDDLIDRYRFFIDHKFDGKGEDNKSLIKKVLS